MHGMPRAARLSHLGVQQQHADANELEHFAERRLVLFGVVVVEVRRCDAADVRQHFGRVDGQRARRRAREPDAAEKAAAPLDQRFGAVFDRRIDAGQQRLEAEIGILELRAAFGVKPAQRRRRSARPRPRGSISSARGHSSTLARPPAQR